MTQSIADSRSPKCILRIAIQLFEVFYKQQVISTDPQSRRYPKNQLISLHIHKGTVVNSTSTDTLGGRIGSELKRSGISMRELARRIDIAQPSISKWCSNQAVPRVIYLERWPRSSAFPPTGLTYRASTPPAVTKSSIRPRPESSETIGLSLTADSAKRTFGTEANKLSLFTQESDDMAPTIRSGSLVVINHTINKVIGSGVYLVQVGETKELRRIQPLVDGTLDIRIDNPKRFANEIATDDKIVILGKVLSTVSVKHIR